MNDKGRVAPRPHDSAGGGRASGKTIFGLRFLVHGARDCGEPDIFVAFEESSKRIVINTEGFGWNLMELQRKQLYFMDAEPSPVRRLRAGFAA